MMPPTLADVLTAVESFGATYHALCRSVDALREQLQAHDASSTRDRASLREQLLSLQRHVDRRFDAVSRELDAHADLLAELQAARIATQQRLSDIDARLAALELQPDGDDA